MAVPGGNAANADDAPILPPFPSVTPNAASLYDIACYQVASSH
jgi:hypothetical protein